MAAIEQSQGELPGREHIPCNTVELFESYTVGGRGVMAYKQVYLGKPDCQNVSQQKLREAQLILSVPSARPADSLQAT